MVKSILDSWPSEWAVAPLPLIRYLAGIQVLAGPGIAIGACARANNTIDRHNMHLVPDLAGVNTEHIHSRNFAGSRLLV